MQTLPIFFLGQAELKYQINHIYFKWRGSLFLPYQTCNGIYILFEHLLFLYISFLLMDKNQFTKACQVMQVKMSITDTKYINNMNQYKNILGYLSDNI